LVIEGSWISLLVTYCMVLNPSMCRVLEVVPATSEIVSIPECIKGGATADLVTFTLDHTQWRVKGWRCTEKPRLVIRMSSQPKD
jgi:hypothetical protein